MLEATTVRRRTPATIVIPAFNASFTLDAQLDAIANQDCPGPVEVIVVDNRSTDATAAVAEAWADRIRGLRVLSAPDRASPGYARNVGIAAATHDHVLMCDADDVVDRSWASNLVEALRSSDAVGGGAISWDGGPLPTTARPNAFSTGLGFLPGFSTCSAAIRKHAWEAVDGFDETLSEGEDLDLAWRVQLAGFTLSDRPEAFVYYREPTGIAGALRKWYRYGRCQVRLYVKHRDAGLPADPPWKAAAKWLLLLATSYRLLGDTPARRVWCRDAGRRVGRLAGSLHERVLFL